MNCDPPRAWLERGTRRSLYEGVCRERRWVGARMYVLCEGVGEVWSQCSLSLFHHAQR